MHVGSRLDRHACAPNRLHHHHQPPLSPPSLLPLSHPPPQVTGAQRPMAHDSRSRSRSRSLCAGEREKRFFIPTPTHPHTPHPPTHPPTHPTTTTFEKCAQSMLQVHCRGGCTWKSGHYFHEPLASGSHLFAVRAFPQKSFSGPR